MPLLQFSAQSWEIAAGDGTEVIAPPSQRTRAKRLTRAATSAKAVVNLSGGFSVPMRRFTSVTSFSATLAMV